MLFGWRGSAEYLHVARSAGLSRHALSNLALRALAHAFLPAAAAAAAAIAANDAGTAGTDGGPTVAAGAESGYGAGNGPSCSAATRRMVSAASAPAPEPSAASSAQLSSRLSRIFRADLAAAAALAGTSADAGRLATTDQDAGGPPAVPREVGITVRLDVVPQSGVAKV